MLVKCKSTLFMLSREDARRTFEMTYMSRGSVRKSGALMWSLPQPYSYRASLSLQIWVKALVKKLANYQWTSR